MSEQNLNPDALEAMSRVMNPFAWAVIDRHPEDDLVIMTKEAELAKAEKLAAAYLSALPAQPDTVNSVEELDKLPPCSVIVDKHGDAGLIEYGHVKFAETAKLPMSYVAKRYLPATVIHRPVEG